MFPVLVEEFESEGVEFIDGEVEESGGPRGCVETGECEGGAFFFGDLVHVNAGDDGFEAAADGDGVDDIESDVYEAGTEEGEAGAGAELTLVDGAGGVGAFEGVKVPTRRI